MSKEKFNKIKKIVLISILAAFIIDKSCEYFFERKPDDIIQFYDLPNNTTDSGYNDASVNEMQGINAKIISDEEQTTEIDERLLVYTDEAPDDFLIDINSATSEQLQSLYRIGPSLANKIIEYRDNYGYYATIEEIKEVSGIGDKTYEKIKDYIKAEQ